MERRRLVIRDAHHENLIEGLSADADAEPIFDAYIRGEIELDDIFLRIKELYRLR
ncbi:antitoxin VbhA family protein [Methylocystis sp.]|uniref:antitoxin VbhA family protein n=1 Tax=Methylocystis sp. TaxID=1911079 RepID=UPI0025D22884|nr:antitoxin VbhA family protein [Methylocystis sp.]